MYNVDFIGNFAFCNYWKWPLRFNRSKTFKMAAIWIPGHFSAISIFLDLSYFWILLQPKTFHAS